MASRKCWSNLKALEGIGTTIDEDGTSRRALEIVNSAYSKFTLFKKGAFGQAPRNSISSSSGGLNGAVNMPGAADAGTLMAIPPNLQAMIETFEGLRPTR